MNFDEAMGLVAWSHAVDLVLPTNCEVVLSYLSSEQREQEPRRRGLAQLAAHLGFLPLT